jgi:simple sugar transport system permease protein
VSTAAPPAPPAPPEASPPPADPGYPGPLGGFFNLSGAGGVITSILTTILAFICGGIVILATGNNPGPVYKGIFDGTGLNWFFPWVQGAEREAAAFNLQQTLLYTSALILCGLAVAFAFRCGMFNIGGYGQFIMGAITATWVGSSWADLTGPLHIAVAVVLATLAGAAFAGIAGLLKATTGAHEVVVTIMLNWIAWYVGSWAFGLGGPLQNDTNPSVPISNDIVDAVKLPVFWGEKELQGLHIGFLIAIAALVVYWLILSRTTVGFRVRAVGRNPEAARYGGISVARSYFTAMAISGAFAGLAGALDILGWQYRLGTLDVQASELGFIGIAVALLGRNTAIGVFFSALLFGALIYGTSTRSIDPNIFDPQLAGNLATMIQALVLLFIGADVLILYLWRRRKGTLPAFRRPRLRTPLLRQRTAALAGAAADAEVAARAEYSQPAPPRPARPPLADRAQAWARARVPSAARGAAMGAIALGVLAFFLATPPATVREIWVPIVIGLAGVALGAWAVAQGERRLGYIGIGLALIGGAVGAVATQSSVDKLDTVFVWGALAASMFRYATPLIWAALGGMFSERSGVINIGLEGMLLMGAFFGILGADKTGSWVVGVLLAAFAGAMLAAIHAVVSVSWRADQIVSGTAVWFLGLGLTGYLYIDIYGAEGTPGDVPGIPNVSLGFLEDVPFFGEAFGDLNLLIWLGFLAVIVSYFVVFRTPFGLRLRSVGEHPRAAETVGLSVIRTRYVAVIISGALAGLGGAFLSIGFLKSFFENVTFGAGFIALAALIFGNWKPKGIFLAALLFGLSSAIAQRMPVYSDSYAILFETLPYIITIVAVAGLIGRTRPPASIGIPYERT